MTRGREAGRGDGIVRWLLPASVLHVAVVLAGALWSWAWPVPERVTPPFRSVEPQASLELTLLGDGERVPAPLVVPPRSAPGRSQPLDALASDERPAQRVARGLRPDAARVAAESQRAVASSLEVASGATPPRAPSDDRASTPASDDSPAEARAKLSLDELGVGSNPFLDIAIQPLTKEERASARLSAALHPPSFDLDRQRGLGAGLHEVGPVADAARRLVIDDERLVETSAVLNVRVDAAGHVTEVHVLDASSQNVMWQMIAARLTRALASAKLRADGSPQGWDMKLRLASAVRLPSGAAPGMRLGVLGRQVAGSGGPGSTSLELSPTAKLDLKEPIDSIGRHMDDPIRFEVMLLKLRADLTDINATARRVVEVAVLSIDPSATP
jgi:hypothetical protein